MIKRFLADESAATAIEYGLIMALIFLAIVTAPVPIGQTLSNTFNDVVAGLGG
jgi:pilus assembly protein Flp/PilA